MTLPPSAEPRTTMTPFLRAALVCAAIAIAAGLFLRFARGGHADDVFGWEVFVVVAICELLWLAGAGLALFLGIVAVIRGVRNGELLPAIVTAVVALGLTVGYVAYLLSGVSLIGD